MNGPTIGDAGLNGGLSKYPEGVEGMKKPCAWSIGIGGDDL